MASYNRLEGSVADDPIGPFGVDPGAAAQPAGDAGLDMPAPPFEPNVPFEAPGDPMAVQVVGVEQVEHILSAIWTLCRHTLGRDVEGAFQPTEQELREQARPTAAVLNRSARAVAIAQHGDAIGMVTQVGGYAAGEIGYIRQAQAAAAAGLVPPPDAGTPGPTGPLFRPYAGEEPGGDG
jgi:hypothetical protein